MKNRFTIAAIYTLFAACALLSTNTTLAQLRFTDLALDFVEYRLDNGLRLVVHEDHKTPVAAVNIWYHVGSKDERPGITGFAHLFEHLMFNGSENYDDEWFGPLLEAGATDLNGTTWFDRTNYFQTVPVNALDRVLWMESDRMGHFIGAITQDKLDEQRDVVKNEKRQGDNQPYRKSQYTQLAGMYPQGHPYSWSTIGSMEDLNKASLEDVKNWFATYYGPSNAVLVVAGDVEPDDVYNKVKHYFGNIEPVANPPKRKRWIPVFNEPRFDIVYDRVPQKRLTRAWHTANFGESDNIALRYAAAVLGMGDSSRLHKRLVEEEQLATDVIVHQMGFELSGLFEIEVYLKQGVSENAVSKILDQELEKIRREKISAREFNRIKVQLYASYIRGLEKVGGFSGKAQMLARFATLAGTPDAFNKELQGYDTVTRKDIRDAAKRWLSKGDYNLLVLPEPPDTVTGVEADRSALPGLGGDIDFKLPDITETTLDNGINVIYVQRENVPLTEVIVQTPVGFTAEPKNQLGLAGLTAAMLDKGTKNYSREELAEALSRLGATLATGARLERSIAQLSALDSNLEPSLALLAEVIQKPLFDVAEFEKLKSNWLEGIAQEKSNPRTLSSRVLPTLLYPGAHPYHRPFTGSGDSESVSSLSVNELSSFYRQHWHPDKLTVFVTSSKSSSDLTPLINRYMGRWKAEPSKTELDTQNSAPAITPDSPTTNIIYLIDRPNSAQSTISAGLLLPPALNEQVVALEMANKILGGDFTARINLNLREDKGWTYGARSSVIPMRQQQALVVSAPVQKDKTGEAIAEIIKEFDAYTSTKKASGEELNRFKQAIERKLPGSLEKNRSLIASIASHVNLGHPADYIRVHQQKVADLSLQQVINAASEHLKSDKLVWLAIGDVSTIRDQLEAHTEMEIVVLDQPLKAGN